MALVAVDRVRKRYGTADAGVEALAGISLTIDAGEFVAIVGPSGCGKSTLLHLCGAMDRPTSGDVLIEGASVASLDDEGITRLRRERIGFVFQFFNLLPTLTVVENVALPLMLAGARAAQAGARARAVVEPLGLGGRLHHYPAQLSGGELQRAAIARAIVHEPVLLVADEPTGNLDSDSGARTLALLADLNRRAKLTMLLATHDRDVAAAATRTIFMRDGRIERVDSRAATA